MSEIVRLNAIKQKPFIVHMQQDFRVRIIQLLIVCISQVKITFSLYYFNKFSSFILYALYRFIWYWSSILALQLFTQQQDSQIGYHRSIKQQSFSKI
jgi:hypothetical protein